MALKVLLNISWWAGGILAVAALVVAVLQVVAGGEMRTDATEDQHDRNEHRCFEQHALDEAMQHRADQRGRQEGDQHADDEAPRGRVGGYPQGDVEQAAEINRGDGQDRAELDQDLEGFSVRFKAEKKTSRIAKTLFSLDFLLIISFLINL